MGNKSLICRYNPPRLQTINTSNVKPPINYPQWKRIMYLIMVQNYPHITESANWKNIKASLKKINWPEVLAKHESSEEKLRVILEIVIKIIEENFTAFRNQRGSHS